MALPTASHILVPERLPELPKSWSALTWRQLTDCWAAKMRYGGNADVARAAALLALCDCSVCRRATTTYSPTTGEAVYTLQDGEGRLWTVAPRELSQMAQQALPWFDYPYGDPGKEAVKDEKGKVIEESVAPVRGYVNTEWRDAMALPEETIVIVGDRMLTGTEWQAMTEKERKQILSARVWRCNLHSSLITHHFQLPSVALYNITWQQYRTLQSLAPLLFQEGTSDDDILSLQAQFVAHTLVPAKDTPGGDAFSPKHEYKYDSDRAEQTVQFWRKLLTIDHSLLTIGGRSKNVQCSMFNVQCLYYLCFQTYQTAMHYYEQVFPLLFSGGGKSDPLQDALTGEVGTINAVMKYQGYMKPEDVYAENLPVILSTLNTMAKEAKDIEAMNARIKHKR